MRRLMLGLIVGTSAAYAGPIHYDEGTGGDLEGVLGPTFVLGSGNNRISGTFGSLAEFDSFEIVVPEGQHVDRIRLVLDPQPGVTWLTSFRIGNVFQDVRSTDRRVDLFDQLMPLGPGTYDVTQAYYSGNAPDLTTGYSWSIHATPRTVPEPGTMALMGSGLVALFMLVRRRRTEADSGTKAERRGRN